MVIRDYTLKNRENYTPEKAIFKSENLDTSILSMLTDEISDNYELSQNTLIEMEYSPEDTQLVRSLFRSIHSIKGDLGVVGFSPLLPLVNIAEDLLNLLREGQIEYSPLLSDLILLILDRVLSFIDNYRYQGFAEYDPKLTGSLNECIHQIEPNNNKQSQSLIAQAIRLLDPAVTQAVNADTRRLEEDDFLDEFGLSEEEDLHFYRDLMEPVESRLQYWHGRCDRILKLSLILNSLGGHQVDDRDLAVAVYVHDFGMACIPVNILHKSNPITDSELALLQSHVYSSAQLLQSNDRWKAAKEIVLQHHEMSNGRGYPNKLTEEEICPGAKIIAIADTFEAMTHQRAYAAHQKRPILRALREITECSGKQLSPYWVEVFREAAKSVLATPQRKKN